jgi:hypothetical protein
MTAVDFIMPMLVSGVAVWHCMRPRSFLLKCMSPRADGESAMLKPSPAKSNTQRQREFRKRNPGYYGRLHRRERAGIEAERARLAAAANVVAVEREPLMLPAPVEVLEIPGLNRIPAVLELSARLLVPVAR